MEQENKNKQLQERKVVDILPLTRKLHADIAASSKVEMLNIVKTYSHRGIVDYEKIFTDGTQMSVVKRVGGEEETTRMLSYLINDVASAFNTYTMMSGAQIVDLAEEMMEELWWIKLEELVIFFNNIKKGYYVKIHSRFDAAIIWECWNMYAEQRMNWCYENQSKHKALEMSEQRSGEQMTQHKIKENVKAIRKAWDNYKPNEKK